MENFINESAYFDETKLFEEESDLGVLDNLIVSKTQYNNQKAGSSHYERITIRIRDKEQGLELGLYKIGREYPLVLDHIKKLFKIYRTRYFYSKIEGLKYLTRLCVNEVSLDDYIKLFSSSEISHKNKIKNIGVRPSFINEVRRIIAFNWIMCVSTVNTESKIFVRCLNPTMKITTENFKEVVVYPFTCNEREYSKDITACDISDKTLVRWFSGNREYFYEHIKKLMKDIDIERFRIVFEKILQKINPLLSPWVDIVYNRMKSIQYLNVEEEEYSSEED